MNKKNLLLLVFLSLLAISLAYAKGGDFRIMGVGATITYPNGGYDYQIDHFSWLDSSSEIIIHSCFYELNSMSYTMLNCNPGDVSFSPSLTDNNYLLKLWYNFSYDAEPGVNYSNVVDVNAFYIDTISPQIVIISPTDASYNSPVTGLYYNIIEANPSSCWYSNDSGQNNHSITCGDNVTSLTSNEGSNIWTVCAKDIVNHEACDTVTFWVDSVTPLIEFTEPTTASGNYPQNSIWATVTASDTNLQSIIINLYNSTGLVASQSGTISPLFQNFTGLSDGTYYLNATVNDTIGHMNQTETRTIMLDTTAPVVTLVSPYNNQPFAFGQDVTFNFNVVEANPYTCDLILNGNINQTNFNNGNTLSLPSGNQYVWNIQCTDSVGNSNTAPESITFTVLSNLTFPPGTDFPDLTLEPNISRVWFWVRNEFGMINWTQPLDLSRGANWADYIALTFNNANVNSILAPELNEQADITFYNISWESPQILRDSVLCSSEICNPVSYTVNVSYMFNVTSFSTYETRETPKESVSTSSGSGSSCITNWTCTEWSLCIGNIQARTCTKAKEYCNTITIKPEEKQSCIEQKSVNKTVEQSPSPEAAQPEKEQRTGITGFVIAHPASTAATLIALLGLGSYFVVSRIRARNAKPGVKDEKKEGVTWISAKSAEKVDSV